MRISLVTGANRGLGLQTAKELLKKGDFVYLGVRDKNKGEEAAQDLPGQWEVLSLDVSNADSVTAAIRKILEAKDRLDVLVNNAGIFPNEGTDALSRETFRQCLETNVVGLFHLCQEVVPHMRKNAYGRIVNVSSGMGQLSEMEGGSPAYRISKTAVNAVTRIFAQETDNENILVNSVCPGWVRTDMGGESAHRSVKEGAATLVWAACLPDEGPSGGFFRDRKSLEW